MKKILLLTWLLAASMLKGQQTIFGSRTIAGDLVVNGTRSSFSRGTTLPATCTVGDVFFKTDAAAGQNVYGCTATNTWTVQGGSGSGTLTSIAGESGGLQTGPAITLSKTNDTNVTLAISGAANAIAFALGWTGTLAKARMVATTVHTDQVNTFGAFKQSFTSSASTAGYRDVPISGDPSTLVDGDRWYDSGTNKFRCRENGSSKDCIPAGSGGITSLGGLTGATQTFAAVDDTNIDLQIVSSGTAHTFTVVWLSTLAKARQHAATVYNDQANTYVAGMKQSFTSDATTPGSRDVPYAGDPSGAVDGDRWYNSITGSFRCKEAGDVHDCVTSALADPGANGIVTRTAPDVTTSTLGTLNRLIRWASTSLPGDANIAQDASTGALSTLKNLSFPTATAITASATPTWDLALNNTYTFAPTANVTSWTISNAPAGVTTLVLVITNDSTPRTVAAPTGFVGFDGPDTAAGSVYVQIFDKVGSAYYGRVGRCLSGCSTGKVVISGLTSGSVTLSAADAAGSPAQLNFPAATGAASSVMQSDGATPQQTSWQATSGSGNLARVTSPTFVTPALGTPSAAVLTNATGLPLSTGVTGTLPNNSVGPTNLPTPGTSVTFTAPRSYVVCTGTPCTVTVPVPAAGYEFCAIADNNVAIAITLSAIGSSSMYQNTAGTAYGTAGTGTLVSTAVVGNRVCLLGRDATHYLTVSYVGTWTVN